MVKWIADRTGRFAERPHYEPNEIDNDCERIITQFLSKLHGRVDFPIDTDDVAKLIESRASDLDMYADLSEEGPDVEGVTRFAIGMRPAVAISSHLSESENRKNRLRTTMAHEFGHVVFHDSLFQMKMTESNLFAKKTDMRVVCKRDRIVDAPKVDWIEWQAGYASGAILMPKSPTMRLVEDFRRNHKIFETIAVHRDVAAQLIALMKSRFDVSEEAARVRLIKLGVLSTAQQQPTLKLF